MECRIQAVVAAGMQGGVAKELPNSGMQLWNDVNICNMPTQKPCQLLVTHMFNGGMLNMHSQAAQAHQTIAS